MLNELRERIATYLLEHQVCIISTAGSAGVGAMPVRYVALAGAGEATTLGLECLLPRWADVVYHLEENPRAVLIVVAVQAPDLRWLQILGEAKPIASPDWDRLLPRSPPGSRPEERFVAVHVTPARIDLIDEGRGWGTRETLDL